MSGGAASAGWGGVEWGYRPPFTALQWQELEQQAMIYKYLVAGLPVPPDLLAPIRRSFDTVSAARFCHQSAIGYHSYYGKKFDPEPGRCRRTDGKKWRCLKEAHPDSKYCERHMHRGRNCSRKHVESQSTSRSQTVISQVSTGGSTITNDGNFCGSSSGSLKRTPLYSVDNLEGSSLGRNATRIRMEHASYGIDNKEFRYAHGLTPYADGPDFTLESLCSAANLGLGCGAVSSTWCPILSPLSSSLSFEQNSGNSSSQPHIPHAFELIGSTLSKQQQQQPEHLFLGEWSTTKDSWSNLNESGSDQSIFSSTQLSISIPRGSPDCSLTSSHATNDT